MKNFEEAKLEIVEIDNAIIVTSTGDCYLQQCIEVGCGCDTYGVCPPVL